MTDTGTLQCRLCAETKQSSQFTNLQTDADKRGKVLAKLSYFRIVTSLDSTNDKWAKTVCLLCIYLLEKAYDLITKIEAAQSNFPVSVVERDIKKVTTSKPAYKQLLISGSDSDSDDAPAGYSGPKEIQIHLFSKNPEQESVKRFKGNEEPKDTDKNKPNSSKQRTDNDNIKHKNDSGSVDMELPLISWKDYTWLCGFCDAVFTHFDDLRKHTMCTHKSCNVYRCIDCKSRSFEIDKFLKHVLEKHQQYLNRSCYKCHEVLPNSKALQRHKRFHMNSDNKCSGCNETFQDLEELSRHRQLYKMKYKNFMLETSPELPDNHTCVECKKTFEHRIALKSHLLTHTDRPRNFICDKCGKGFLTKAQITEHLLIHDNIKEHQCKICKKYFRSLSNFRQHMGVHDKERPFSCKECGKRFRLEKYLRTHATVHTNEKPYVCSICNKGFRFVNKLNEHRYQHTGERPYACEICPKSFTNYPNYYKHVKIHIGKSKPKDKE